MNKRFTSALVGIIVFMMVANPLVAYADLNIKDNTVSAAPKPTYAEGVDITYNGAVCAMANVLTWEMLQTYLYGVAGQQAYDVYANDEERQETLYSDFIEFCEDTARGAQWSFQMNKNSAIVCYMTGKQALNYYKTAGSSALAEMQEKAKAGMRVINGGLSNNSLSPTPSPDKVEIVNLKEMELIGTGALTKCIGDYIVALVNGERGEVSETFLNPNGIPTFYFDGEYEIDGEGRYYFWGERQSIRYYSTVDRCYYCPNTGVPVSYWNYNFTYDMVKNARFGFFLDSDYGDGYCRLVAEICGVVGSKNYDNNEIWKCGSCFEGVGLEEARNDHMFVKKELANSIAGVPVFSTQEELEYFLETGDYRKALNYFKGEVKPADWLNYDFSQIASKLDDILQALTVLPIITTEDLAGFAQGIANGIVVGNVPASDPVAQQQQMQELLEENARKTATGSMANAVTDSETETDYTDGNPRPTATPEEITKKEEKRNATMVIDLREFFPFCIPFDLIRLIKVLNAEPQAPSFEGAIKYDKLGINVPVKLDLSMFDDGAKVFRACELILFILSLLLVTRTLIRG